MDKQEVVENEKTSISNYGSRNGKPLWRIKTD